MALQNIRRAFAEFLLLPTCIILAALLLAASTYWLDRLAPEWLQPTRQFLEDYILANPEATGNLLSSIAGGLISVTSITISLLLVVVQQTAANLSSEVFDQFLRRRHNQAYFGYFVGVALYALITLATVNAPFNPVLGGMTAFLLTVVALYLLILLLYTTINQMRPIEIIEMIHQRILVARGYQRQLLHRTRRVAISPAPVKLTVDARRHGFVTHIQLSPMAKALEAVHEVDPDTEIVLLVTIGSYIAFKSPIAKIKAQTDAAACQLAESVYESIQLERKRDVVYDPSYGIEQLEAIAWTSISSAKSSPSSGTVTLLTLRNILAHWCEEQEPDDDKPPLAIVFQDQVFLRLLAALESLAVVSSESMQHQNYIEVLRTMALFFERIPPRYQARAEDLVLRILPALGDLVLTAELDDALAALHNALREAGRLRAATAVQEAAATLRDSVGKLRSRTTRVLLAADAQEGRS